MTGFGAMTTLPRAIVTPGDVLCKPCPGDVVLSQSPSTTICCAIYFLQSCIQAWNWNLYHYQTTYSSFTTSKTLAGHVKVTPAYLLNSSHLLVFYWDLHTRSQSISKVSPSYENNQSSGTSHSSEASAFLFLIVAEGLIGVWGWAQKDGLGWAFHWKEFGAERTNGGQQVPYLFIRS